MGWAASERAAVLPTVLVSAFSGGSAHAANVASAFNTEEAAIASTHAAIQSGQVACKQIVQAYIERAKAYNGVCTALVTADGRKVPAVKGYIRAGAPLTFPTRTVRAATICPDLDQYRGLPLDYSRMERMCPIPASTPKRACASVGQLNALETLNLRGERSMTCKGNFDAHPSTGRLPTNALPECETFRQQPDALEHAAELDAKYGSNPNLESLPMYCITMIVKDPYDTKDMRTTWNNDVNFAMDAPPFDSSIVAQLRAKGAIIHGKSVPRIQRRAWRSLRQGKAAHESAQRRTNVRLVGRAVVQSLRYRAGLARLGRGDQRQSRDGRHLRTIRRLLSGSRFAQRDHHAADDEGRAARQRRHR